VLGAFLVSGVAGLSYELAWLRYLTHLFGASTPAVSATVAVFFTGLALGSAIGGNVFDRARRPFLAYGILEALIAVAACSVPFVFHVVERALAHSTLEEGTSIARRLALSCALLLVPTTFIGATFPAMAAVLRHVGNPTRSTGLFYGINTLGATCGALIVAFVSMPVLGPAKTTWAMACLNVAIALTMVVLERIPAKSAAGSDATAQESTEAKVVVTPDQELGVSVAMVVAAASGLLAIALEVLITRLLTLAFTSSVHVFALTLAAFLVGIAVGAVVVAQYHSARAPKRVLLWGATTASMLAVLVALPLMYALERWALGVVRDSGTSSWTVFLSLIGSAAVFTLLPATVIIGTVLPMVVGLATAQLERASQVAGRLYAVNTVAGVFGSLVATFVVMPALGLSRSIVAISLGYGLLSLLVGVQTRNRWMPASSAILLGLPVFLLLGWRPTPEFDDPRSEVLYHRDEPAGTVTIDVLRDGYRALRVNRLQTLNNGSPESVEMHYALGHLPLLIHGSPQKVLMIGFATGTTVAAMAEHPEVEIDCVEIHGSLPKLASFFSPANQNVASNPRVHITAADGRYFVDREGPSYDVIVGDLFFPRDVGVSALYSKEHFAAIHRRLSPRGVAVVWLPIYQLSPDEMAIIIQSYLSSFPQAEGWVGHWPLNAPAIGLVGRVPPGDLSSVDTVAVDTELEKLVRASLSKGFPNQEVNSEVLAVYQRYQPGNAPSRRLLTSDQLREWAGNSPMNTVENPSVEYTAPRTLFESRGRGAILVHQQFTRIGKLRPLDGTPFVVQ
jgi:spermidine synthase